MNPIDALAGELEQEMASTRRLLERVPQDHFDHKPHAKSFDLASLAMHLAFLPRWGAVTLETEELDLATTPNPPRPTSVTEILGAFDSNVAAFRSALERTTLEGLGAPWTLRMGDHAIFTMPRGAVLRGMVFNHIYHHRGQLTVYLRLLDVALPSVYGPTADEQFGG